MPPDEADEDDDDAPLHHAAGRRVALSPAQVDEVRRLSRIECRRLMRDVGINISTDEKRDEFRDLIRWTRARKAAVEGGFSKFWTGAIGAAAAAAGAAVFGWLTGQHK